MKKQKKIKTCRYSDEFWKNVWYTIRYGDSLGDRIIIPLLSLCILLCISFLIFLLTSCTADPLSVTAPEGTGTEGLRTPLTIGLLTIEGNDGYDGSVPATTRMATDPAGKDNAWEAGDCIAVSAPKLGNNDMGSKTLTATYVYTGIADNLWRQINPNDNSDPYRAQAEATDIYPLYIDDIDRNSGKTISVETYGGSLHWEGSITYTNQTTRKNYCLQNYLSCDNARIAEVEAVVVRPAVHRIGVSHVDGDGIDDGLHRSRRIADLSGSRAVGGEGLFDTARERHGADKGECRCFQYVFHFNPCFIR